MARRDSRDTGQGWAQVAIIAAAAIVLVAAVYGVMEWQRSRPGTPVAEMTVEVSSAGQTTAIAPYTICELDAQCDGGTPPAMPRDPQTVTVRVPDDIASGSWRLLMIYDDPAANDELVFTSGQASSHDIDAVTETGAALVVAEVSALQVDTNDDGEEVPVVATWSVGFN